MNRRKFLGFPLAALALTTVSRGAGTQTTLERASSGLRVATRKDRYDEELLIMGRKFDLKVSRQDSGGDLCIYDTMRESKGGPALHRHHSQDEWFYVIRGTFLVRVGEDTFTIGPGDSAFA